MITILQGDAIEQMRTLPAESVHLIVTSPPYWGLRDYQIPPSIWGGDAECEHEWWDRIKKSGGAYKEGSKKRRQHSSDDFTRDDRFLDGHPEIPAGATCVKCNAWRGVFGLEPTPELYLDHSVQIFREAWRVLRKDGTLWVNLGDSYATGAGKACVAGGGTQGSNWAGQHPGRMKQNGLATNSGAARGPTQQPNRMPQVGLKSGDLVGIPWRVALALQADGWFLRRDNIWFKPNPMPESVNGWRWEQHRVKVSGSVRANSNLKHGAVDIGRKPHGTSQGPRDDNGNAVFHSNAEYIDCSGCEKCAPNGGLILRKGNWRCTTSHEYVFQFSKSDSYFCDAEAARERTSGGAHGRGHGVNPKANEPNCRMVKSRTPRDYDDKPNPSSSNIRSKQNASFSAAVNQIVGNRNLRSVWRIPTAPYKGAHFATFPPNLVRPILAAASPVQCCAKCGAPWAPVVVRGEERREQQLACGSDANGDYFPTGAGKYFDGTRAENARTVKQRILAGMVTKRVIAHRATCKCGAGAVAAVVLDMFGGSGTTAQVAGELGRNAIVIELNPAYIPLIKKRTHAPGLALS